MKDGYHKVYPLNDIDQDSPERVEISFYPNPMNGKGDVFVSIYDDTDECVTFLADQINAITDALVYCKQYRNGIEAGERRNAADINFKSDRLVLRREASKIKVEDMPVDEELILSGLVINSRKNRGE